MRPDALTTLADTKLALGLPPSTGESDSLIEHLIEASTDIIERATGRKFVMRNYNDGDVAATPTFHGTTQVPDEPRLFIDGCGQTSIVLPNFPIVETGFVLESLATRAEAGDTWTVLVKNEDYVLDRVRGILRVNGGSLARGIKNYRITVEAGYMSEEEPWVPDDLQRLCQEMVKEAYQDKSRVTSETIGSWSRSYDISKPNTFLEAAMSKYTSDANFL